MLALLAAAIILPAHTPGAYNPAVTQATLRSTVCVAGYTATVRPPASFTDALKRRQLVAFGYRDRVASHYEEDHFVPLELGGAPRDPANLWPEPSAQARLSDPLENTLHRDLCAGRLTLRQARARIVAWKRAHG